MPRVPLLVLLLLLPLAAADHVYSHRLVVTGRVVDADGSPVAGQPVAVEFPGFAVGGPCFDSGDERTGPQGDYRVCRHAHDMPEPVRATVTVRNASGETTVDPALRRATLHLRIPDPVPGARDLEGERLFARTFRVEGRVMVRAEGALVEEGVSVPSAPVRGGPVNVTLLSGDERIAHAEVGTDDHGDYAADLDAADVPSDARLLVQVGEHLREAAADATLRRTDVDLVVTPTPRSLPDGGGAVDERPGTKTPRVPLPWPLAVLALAGAAALLRKR